MYEDIIEEYYVIIRQKVLQANFDGALASIEKLLSNFSNNELAYYYKGVCQFAKNDYKNACESFSRSIKINPANGKAYFNLGATFYVLKQVDLALVNIAKALFVFTRQRELDSKKRCMDALKYIESRRK